MDARIDFSRFFDLSHDLLCVAGPDGYFKLVNPAFTRELGWSAEVLMARSFLEFVHPEDVEATKGEIETLAEGLPTIRFENRYRHEDGSFRRLTWTSFLDRPTGLIYAVARVD